jgi:PAS domain S-box-containing protein
MNTGTPFDPQAVDALQSIFGRMRGFLYRCAANEAFSVLFITPSIANVTGHRARDLLSGAIDFTSLVLPEDRRLVEPIVNRCLEERTEWDIEYRMFHREGREVWVCEQGAGVFDADGQLLYVEGFVFNAEGRRAAEMKDQQRLASLSGLSRQILADTDDILRLLKTLSILSFNARTEAARTGEAGRAFSVIGEQIARLASEADAKARKLDGYLSQIKGIIAG